MLFTSFNRRSSSILFCLLAILIDIPRSSNGASSIKRGLHRPTVKDSRTSIEKIQIPYSFFGHESFLEVDAGDLLPYGLMKVQLSFASPRKHGLLFLAMHLKFDDAIFFKEDFVNFYALQLVNGYLVSVFNYGDGVRRVVHKQAGRLSDNRLHNVTVKTKRKHTRLWVDSKKRGPRTSNILLSTKPYFRASKIFIGGLPLKRHVSPNRGISKISFTGTISQLCLKGWCLSESKEWKKRRRYSV